MKSLRLLLLMVCLSLALPGPIFAETSAPPMKSTNYAITWSALEETHGGGATSDNFQMKTAVMGQMFTQADSASDTYGLCTGYACTPTANYYYIYLPLTLRM